MPVSPQEPLQSSTNPRKKFNRHFAKFRIPKNLKIRNSKKLARKFLTYGPLYVVFNAVSMHMYMHICGHTRQSTGEREERVNETLTQRHVCGWMDHGGVYQGAFGRATAASDRISIYVLDMHIVLPFFTFVLLLLLISAIYLRALTLL